MQLLHGDWVRLRALFAKSSYYKGNDSDPYGDILNMLARGSDSDKPRPDRAALKKKISDNFPMWLGHAVAITYLAKDLSSKERGREIIAFVKIKDAILKNGTGKSSDTAFVALSVPESQHIVRELGFDIRLQTLQVEGERHFDVYDAIDPKTKVQQTIWVDVSALFPR
jgi:hypothetical protein